MQLQSIILLFLTTASVNCETRKLYPRDSTLQPNHPRAFRPQALTPRGSVPHNSLFPLEESVPSNAIGDSMRKFEPYMHTAHGCEVYPAVNAQGETSGGLKDSGSSSGGCSSTDRGQTYVRADWFQGRYAIMYAWYWPKDQPIDGNVAGGHRHDWENAVIFIDGPYGSNSTLISAAASGHGEYKKTNNPQREGDRPKVEHFTNFPTNLELQFTDTLGKDFAMIGWDNLSQAARDALQNTDFGDANVPFKDGSFTDNLAKAWL